MEFVSNLVTMIVVFLLTISVGIVVGVFITKIEKDENDHISDKSMIRVLVNIMQVEALIAAVMYTVLR